MGVEQEISYEAGWLHAEANLEPIWNIPGRPNIITEVRLQYILYEVGGQLL